MRLGKTTRAVLVGIVSDVSSSAKSRNYVEMKGGGKTPNAMGYVTEGAVLDDKHAKVHEALGINTK